MLVFETFKNKKSDFLNSNTCFCTYLCSMSQALSKCLSKWIKVDKWNYLKNPLWELKKYFCLGFLEGKLERAHFLKLRFDRMTVWLQRCQSSLFFIAYVHSTYIWAYYHASNWICKLELISVINEHTIRYILWAYIIIYQS